MLYLTYKPTDLISLTGLTLNGVTGSTAFATPNYWYLQLQPEYATTARTYDLTLFNAATLSTLTFTCADALPTGLTYDYNLLNIYLHSGGTMDLTYPVLDLTEWRGYNSLTISYHGSIVYDDLVVVTYPSGLTTYHREIVFNSQQRQI